MGCGDKSAKESFRKGWELVWEDGFDDGLSGDWTKVDRGESARTRYATVDSRVIDVKDGELVLRAVGNEASDSVDGGRAATGAVKRSAMRGGVTSRLEVKMVVKPAEGVTSYVSLVPTDASVKDVNIDIMRQDDVNEDFYHTVSSDYTMRQGMADNPTSMVLVSSNPAEEHVYAVEKYADSLVFYLDGARTKIYPKILTDMPNQFPFDDYDLSLVIGTMVYGSSDTLAVGGEVLVDKVRYYDGAQVE